MRSLAQERLGFGGEDVVEPVPLSDVELPVPRVSPPPSLAEICADDTHARASHAMGKAYRDIVRGFHGKFENVPDVVARPRNEAEVEAVLAWCCDEGYAAIPYGGGTSVCGGVEPRLPGEYPGAVTIDLGALDRVLEVDEVSRSALIQAGAPGPVLEDQLRERGLTMRCFPQSFEFATLGGWVATRAGGHFATKLTHVDDMVESVRAITPAGRLGEPAPSRLGRRAESRPDVGRIRGDPWAHHAGLGAGSPAPALQGVVRSRVRHVPGGRHGRSGDLAVRPRPVQLPPSRPGRGRVHRRGRRPERPSRAGVRVRASPGRRTDAGRCRGGSGERRQAR